MIKRIIVTIIYVIGICCVIFFAGSAIAGGGAVRTPEAMIPFTEFERNSILLGLGFVPMIASCLSVIFTFDIRGRLKRFLVLIPGIVTGIPFAAGICYVVYLIWFWNN